MPGIDQGLEFHPLDIAVLTVSDTRTPDSDASGALLAGRLTAAGHRLAARALVPDDVEDPQADQLLRVPAEHLEEVR